MAFKQYINHDEIDGILNGHVGRRLNDTTQTPRPFGHYMEQVRKNEQLYMALAGGLTPRRLIAWVGDPGVYGQFYNQYRSGMYTRLALYAIPDRLVTEQLVSQPRS